jgi:hypothetical protein
MRIQLIAAGFLSAVALLGAQTSSTEQKPSQQKPSQQKSDKNPPKPITITGCVQHDEANTDRYVLADGKSGVSYHLTGTDVREYIGRRVQIVGGTVASKRLQISGGLKPTPNIAAQGGAIDPGQAAVATIGGSAPTGDVQLPDFRIQAIRPLTGPCSE